MIHTKNIPYARQNISGEDIALAAGVLKSPFVTQGPKVSEFEQKLSRYTGAKYVVALSSGTAALHLSMMALNIAKGDYIITSPISFSASANCALYVGAEPRFVDINDTTYHLDIQKLKDLLKSPSYRRRVKALIPVHFMGTVIDIAQIKRICDKYGIKIVEDAAHALGSGYKNGNKWFKVGSSRHSDITILSFHPIKHITTGEGGAILTNDKKIYESALTLRHHGIIKKNKNFWRYDIHRIGFNYRITDFQCALGSSQLSKLDEMVKKRRRLIKLYNENFSKLKQLRLPYERKNAYASYHLYVIRTPKGKRDKLYSYLKKNNIFSQVNYIPVHLLSYYRKTFGYKSGDFPIAEKYFRECLSLPLYAGLSKSDQSRVINKVEEFFKG